MGLVIMQDGERVVATSIYIPVYKDVAHGNAKAL